MHQAELIDYYTPPGADVKGAADQVRGRVPQIRKLAEQVEKDHKPALDAVAGDLEASMADAPRGAVNNTNNVMQAAEFAAGCLELLSQAIDKHNYHKADRPRAVSTLNAEYNSALSDSFGVDYKDPGPNATQDQKDKASKDFSDAYQSARSAKEAELCREAAQLDGWLDGEADEVGRMLDRGPNKDDIQDLYRAGALAPYAVVVFPNMDLAKIPLPPAAQRELLQYLIDNPDVLVKLPPELAAVVAALPTDIRTDVYVEQRMEHLRRNDLLTGPNPGGYYEKWIRNTVTNNVSLDTVLDIARDHDIRPDDFNVFDGQKELKDDDGKSCFLLDKDISGDDARRAVLMTYVLNAGTGYPGGDFKPTPYSSGEVRRIIDRQDDNDWSYDQDVGFVHENHGRLVTTPNGMLMGIGGKHIYSQAGGTTWGDIFMVNENPGDPEQRLQAVIESGYAPDDDPTNGTSTLDLDRLLHHEERHSRQWADTWAPWYGLRYVTWESRFGLGEGYNNAYERDAGLTDGGYDLPPTPSPTPGPPPSPGPSPTPSPSPGPSPIPPR